MCSKGLIQNLLTIIWGRGGVRFDMPLTFNITNADELVVWITY